MAKKHIIFMQIFCKPERVARFWACVSQALTKMVGGFAVIHLCTSINFCDVYNTRVYPA